MNKLFLFVFSFLIVFTALPNIEAIKNSKTVYKSEIFDLSECGMTNTKEDDGYFIATSLMNLKPGDIFVDVDNTAKKVISVNKSKNRIIIDTQKPKLFEVIESYKLPQQNINMTLADSTADERGKIFDNSLSVNKSYSNKIGKVSFNSELKSSLDVIATIDIPIKKKNGVVNLESKFVLGLQNTRLKAEIAKEYKSDKIKLADFKGKNSVLKIKTQIVTQTIASGGINADFGMSAEVSGSVVVFAELKRKSLTLIPTKCGVDRGFDVKINEAFNISTSKLASLQQQIGIEFEFSCLGINIAKFSSQVTPYAKANGKIESSLSFNVDKKFKPLLTSSPSNILNTECEFGINSNTSIRLIKNLYKKDFGEKSLVVYRCAGNK